MKPALAEEIIAACNADSAALRTLQAVRPVAGGDINQAARLDCDSGPLFVKYRRTDSVAMHQSEAAALSALAATATVATPTPVRFGWIDGYGFLVLEWLPLVARDSATDFRLGQSLAELHRVAQPFFGWHQDNFIGATPQRNKRAEDWPTFFADQRLAPQLRWLGEPELLRLGAAVGERLPRWFEHYKAVPSLLHGDLWSGNAAALADGTPVIYDPASYFGDREAELAMCELFGGFGAEFYRGYDEVWPRDPGYPKRRVLYQLYHLLNHANLFGGGYIQRCARLLRELVQ